MHKSDKYSMAFTTGCLLQQESMILAERFAALKDWNAVREEALSENLLQCRAETTSRKITGELIKRLKYLTAEEIDFLVSANTAEKSWMLWISVCKCYAFIYDFSIEVVREKYLSLYSEILLSDYDNFFNKKADWHDELDRLSESSREKLRQVVFKMLREVGIISKENQLIPSLLSSSFVQTIKKDSAKHLATFPVSDTQVREYML